MITCDKCKHEAPQTVHCDCFDVLCPTCFADHACGREHLARWSGAPDPEPIDEEIEAPRLETLANVNGAITSPIVLRDYQIDAKLAIEAALKTNGSTLLVMATGTGKTVVFAKVIKDSPSGRVMIVAHREELIHQAANQIERVTGEQADIEMADRRADSSILYEPARVVISSVQTQNSGNGRLRMEKFDPFDFDLLIVR